MEIVGKLEHGYRRIKMKGLNKYDSVNGLNSAQYFELLQLANFNNESTSELMMYAKTCENMGGAFYSEFCHSIMAYRPFALQNVLSFEDFKNKLKVTIKQTKP